MIKGRHILAVFFLALLIRFIGLGQSLWLDEGTTAKVVMQYDYLEIISKFSIRDFHPPLYYLFMKLWTNIFGYSEIALRMPSVIFSITTGYFVYLIGGFWASVFFLFNPLVVYYSQEARMYMMATFTLTGGLFYLRRLCHRTVDASNSGKLKMKKILDVFTFSVFIILSFFTFYGSSFFIAAFFLYLLYRKQYKVFFASLMMFISYFAVISPLLFEQLSNSRIAVSQVSNWSSVLGKANLKNLLLVPMKFSIGRLDFHPKWIYYLVSGVWTLLIFAAFHKTSKRGNGVWSYFFIFPLVLGLAFSFFSPLLQYFRFLYLVPVLAVVLGLGMAPKMNIRGAIIFSGFLIFSLIYLLGRQFHREDWKGMSALLDKKTPVYMISSSSDPLKYYRKDLEIKELKDFKADHGKRSVQVIPYTADIHGVSYRDLFDKAGYKIGSKKSFRDLELEIWTQK